MEFRNSRFADIPIVVKVLLILNILLYILTSVMPVSFDKMALYPFQSPNFMPLQIITHMFLHGGFWHLFFNMFSLYMFGRIIEECWGSKRFFIYYFVCGFGAAMLHILVKEVEIHHAMSVLNSMQVDEVLTNGAGLFARGLGYADVAMQKLNMLVNVPTVGASGAIYGLLLAFGMMFPEAKLYLYFAIPVKAKWLVVFFVIIELLMGVLNNSGDNIAHFAHLGGMLFGLVLILIWRRKANNQ